MKLTLDLNEKFIFETAHGELSLSEATKRLAEREGVTISGLETKLGIPHPTLRNLANSDSQNVKVLLRALIDCGYTIAVWRKDD